MAQKNPTDVAKKWADRTKNAGAAYTAGVNSVTESPTEKAAQKVDKYQAGVQRAVDEGRYVNGLRSVSLADWKAATAEKGASRLATGASAAQTKMASFLGEMLPYQEAARSRIEAMPDNTLEERIARSAEMQRLMSQFRRSRR